MLFRSEYWLSAIPLGGYVKMAGDDPENPPAAEERRKGFLTTDLWRKTLIVLAGPVFNLVLPLLIFVPLHASESTLMPSVIGTVAVASFGSGELLHTAGWNGINYGMLPLVAVVLLMLGLQARRQHAAAL